VVVGGIYYFYKYYKPGLEEEALAQLFTAEKYLSLDSIDLALNGDGVHLGTRAVADEYGNTKAGNLASYMTGGILLRKQQFEEALSYLKKASFDDHFHSATRLVLIGDCYSELGDYKEAGDYYMKGAEKRDNKITTPVALMKAALAYEASEEFDESLEALERLTTEYSESQEANRAKILKGKVEAEKSFKK
jgi:tetratricopeptide (TPR) repeat protein